MKSEREIKKLKVEPKLTFEVGEKVVICSRTFGIFGDCDYPDRDRFAFTTIKEVREDGSVITEEGYRYRQSYKTEYGFTDVHDYFRIFRVSQSMYTNINGPEYCYTGWGKKNPEVREHACFIGVNFLFKCTSEFERKAEQIQQEYDERKAEQKRLQEIKDAQLAKEKPIRDAYDAIVKPLEEEFNKKLAEAWKTIMCKNCKHNYDCHCCKWDTDLNETSVSTCSAWEMN